MTQEYRIDLKVRNNLILYKLEKAGYKTIGEFCRLNNVMKYVGAIGDVASMKRSPLDSRGNFIPAIKFLAEKLNCSELDLFSETQMHTILKNNKKVIKVNEAEMKFMLENSQSKQKLLEEIIENDQMNKAVYKSLDTLPPREKKVLSMRFGLEGYSREHTRQEIGYDIGVDKERVRQIEAVALRKLRHPSRTENVREFIEDD